jgi:hypothetical protein
MKRTIRLRGGLSIVAAGGLLLAGCQAVAPQSTPSAGDQPLVLVVTEAASGTYTPAGNAFALTLTDVDPEMTWFDDRPFRHAGTVPLQQALDALYSDETDGPPNAALSVADPEGGPDQVIIVELTEPSYDPTGDGTLTFTATPLDEPKTGLDYYAGLTTDSFPASFGAASLFIDTIFGYNYCGAQVQNTGTVPLGLLYQQGSWDSVGAPPQTIAGGSTVSFEAKSGWASNCNMQVTYQKSDGTGGFQLSVSSPAIGSNSAQISPQGDCQADGGVESTGGATATAQVDVSCAASSTPGS